MMGTPLPGNEPRLGCSECFGPNPILGVIQPRWITLSFSGVIRGPGAQPVIESWPAGPWLLSHVEDCLYFAHHVTHNIHLNWTQENTLVRWTDASGVFLFNAAYNTIHCGTHVPSQITYTPSVIAWGGLCDVTWSQQGL